MMPYSQTLTRMRDKIMMKITAWITTIKVMPVGDKIIVTLLLISTLVLAILIGGTDHITIIGAFMDGIVTARTGAILFTAVDFTLGFMAFGDIIILTDTVMDIMDTHIDTHIDITETVITIVAYRTALVDAVVQ